MTRKRLAVASRARKTKSRPSQRSASGASVTAFTPSSTASPSFTTSLRTNSLTRRTCRAHLGRQTPSRSVWTRTFHQLSRCRRLPLGTLPARAAATTTCSGLAEQERAADPRLTQRRMEAANLGRWCPRSRLTKTPSSRSGSPWPMGQRWISRSGSFHPQTRSSLSRPKIGYTAWLRETSARNSSFTFSAETTSAFCTWQKLSWRRPPDELRQQSRARTLPMRRLSPTRSWRHLGPCSS
mmetsp:Transcript_24553/g.78395  ORF Transcript_24553/g.78395 Transcript_24553/m.78395 type:complete len:239 (+) Transcript_24553:464-1180(+)